ncbi:uncharacterized protein TrAFT101_000248 [Trichoderma asperellum]|uniref:uncharacterized protein n=1 Tax=Trichoderma asperellum TaxID=101201 RepID=UPI00332B1467|nr:hypothetical protein TrAFT101_000248 [Trichoderma asperellum]
MAPEQLDREETRRLLDTITSLDDLCVLFVNTPQIIVVGDQGCGKSSVLEAISRVHLPIGDGVCTRFPIELVLRRAPRERTYLEILFDTKSLDVGGRSFSRTREPFSQTGFPRSELPAIINRAKEHMGLEDGKTTGFSRDVLLVEIEGPDVPSVTLVDLPGVFHPGFSSQLRDWKPVVDDLVDSYMRRPDSIILTVVSADVPLSAHAVLNRAARFDPDGERTIGVITKPDLCPSANIEDQYLRLARGLETNHHLPLGWHVLRNRGPKQPEVDFDERDSDEDLFLTTGTGKWWRLPSSRIGVDSLRKNVAETLLRHIKSKLPDLIEEVEYELQTRQARLKAIGASRTNTNEMREYLLRVSATFHRLAEHAVEGRYNDPFFASATVQETSKIKFRKLRALLRNLNRAFDLTMKRKGARYKIEWEQDQQQTGSGVSAEEQLASYMAEAEAPDYLQPFLELYDFPDPTPKSEATVNSRIERIASGSQGVEFPGLPNSDLIMQLFRDLSEPWRRIAERHVDIVVERTRLFVYHLFDYILEDDKRTRDAILAEYVDPTFETTTETLKSKLDEILRPYTSGHGLPLDLEFRTGLSKRKLTRIATQIADLLKENQNSVTYNTTSYRLLKYEDVRNIVVEANGMTLSSDFGTDVVIDMMLTHYEASLKTFTDNVIHLVIENCLVSDLPDIFSTKIVTQMSDDILRSVAEESGKTKEERIELADDIVKLTLGLQECRRSRPRNFSEPAETFPELTSPTRAPTTPPNPFPSRAIKKTKYRVKLPPFTEYAKTTLSESPFAQVAQTSVDFTTLLKQDPTSSSSGSEEKKASGSNSVPGTGSTTTTADVKPVFGSQSPPKPAVGPVSGSTTASVAPVTAFGSAATSSQAPVPKPPLFGAATTTSQTPAPKTSIFGTTTASSQDTVPTTSLFAAAIATTSKASVPAQSLFGTNTASSSPTPAPKSTLFGAATTTSQTSAPKPSLFSTTAASSQTPAPKPSPLFGASTATTSQTSAPKTSLFSTTTASSLTPSPKPSPLFGASTATTSQTSAPKPSPLFGAATTSSQSPAPKPSLFSAATTTSQASAPKPSLFAGVTTSSQAPAPKPSLFGAATTASQDPVPKPSLFGAAKISSQDTAYIPSLFGSKADSSAPAPKTSLFGAATTSLQSPAPKPSLFAGVTTSSQAPAAKPSLFGTTTTSTTTTTTTTTKTTETTSETTSESSNSTPSKTPSNDGLVGSAAAPPPQSSLFGTAKSSSSSNEKT